MRAQHKNFDVIATVGSLTNRYYEYSRSSRAAPRAFFVCVVTDGYLSFLFSAARIASSFAYSASERLMDFFSMSKVVS